MSGDEVRGYVPGELSGRYRAIRSAAHGADRACVWLASLGFDELAIAARECSAQLRRSAFELLLPLDPLPLGDDGMGDARAGT